MYIAIGSLSALMACLFAAAFGMGVTKQPIEKGPMRILSVLVLAFIALSAWFFVNR